MEHSIGVGAIVGLVFASSTYVWNSNEFTKEQKIFLLIAMVFAPIQWLGILVIRYYNNHKFENTVERKTEKKLDSTISNLAKLKEKGILTEEEYSTKVEKIKVEKTEQNLKNSLEYKQLKSLLDNGVLTKEEFENKIQLLQNTVNEGLEEDAPINKAPIVTAEEKSTNFTILYMITVICILVFWVYYYFQNSNSNNSQDVYPTATIDTSTVHNTNNYNTNYQEPSVNKKFVYIIMKIKKPKLDVFEPISYTNTLGYTVTPEPSYSLNFENETYITEIIEIENYNEDEKYKTIDNAKNKMYSKLGIDDSAYSSNLWVNCKDDVKREEFQKITSKIVDTQIYDFNSYSEASISKEKRD
ncbi:SHOCT domain-containing protein [Flavobacterium psychrophilum]